MISGASLEIMFSRVKVIFMLGNFLSFVFRRFVRYHPYMIEAFRMQFDFDDDTEIEPAAIKPAYCNNFFIDIFLYFKGTTAR